MDPDAAPTPLVARDEGRHAPGEGPWWAERWWFGWWEPTPAGTGPAGGFAELVLLPNQARAWYRAALVRPGEPLLAVVDHDVPMPRVGLELRGEGLWADHTVEAPFEQWTVANETYALAVDDPDELIGRGYGRPVPLAFDVEWYASAAVVRTPTGCEQTGEVVGVVELGGTANHAVHGAAARGHDWGPLLLPALGEPAADGVPKPDVVVPDRWPAPFDVVVDDVLTATGWRRRRRP